jgi:beta-N-acetylhexosaminidase
VCGDVLPLWMEREADNGLAAVCWFSGDSLGELTRRCPELPVLAAEEDGNVNRLEASTERVGAGIGAMARRAGIDVVLAPVVDVNSEPDNPVLGVRSFGADVELVARHGAAFVCGVQSQGNPHRDLGKNRVRP